MKILMPICSCCKYKNRRETQRKTFLTFLIPEITYFFYVGKPTEPCELETNTDIVQLDVSDEYDKLSFKMKACFEYTIKNYTFDYLARIDDDTYIHPPRLYNLILDFKNNYQAEFIGSDNRAYHAWGVGGAGIILSRRVVEVLARAEGDPYTLDDGWIGYLARNEGKAPYHWTPRLCSTTKMRPLPNNDVVSGHYVNPLEMQKIFEIWTLHYQQKKQKNQ